MKKWDFYIRDIVVRVEAESSEEAYAKFESDIEPKMKELGLDYDDIDLYEVDK